MCRPLIPANQIDETVSKILSRLPSPSKEFTRVLADEAGALGLETTGHFCAVTEGTFISSVCLYSFTGPLFRKRKKRVNVPK